MSAASNPTIDLSRLPAPQVIAPLDFESILAALLADFQARWPNFTALLESDPVLKLAEVAAYRELILRGDMNDVARGTMLAFATGADLEAIGARFGVARLVITPATDSAPAVPEPDADLRRRIQLAAERLPWAGMTAGGYVFLALSAAPSLKDVALIKRGAGQVDVVLLGREGDGTVDDATVAAVYSALAEEDAAQLTDVITVRAAAIIPYSPTVRLRIRRGPDPALVRSSAEKAVRAYAADRHKVGLPVYAQQLEAAASVGGVEQAIADIGDVDPGAAGAAWLDVLTIETEIVG